MPLESHSNNSFHALTGPRDVYKIIFCPIYIDLQGSHEDIEAHTNPFRRRQEVKETILFFIFVKVKGSPVHF